MSKASRKIGGSSKRGWVIAILILIILAAVGVTIGITYKPVNAEILFEQFNEQGDILEDNSDTYLGIKGFEKHSTSLSALYRGEYISCVNLINSVKESMDFYECYMVDSVSSNINKSKAKSIQTNLKDAKSNLVNMGAYLSDNDYLFENPTIIAHGWEAVRDYYKEALNSYADAFSDLYDIYSEATFKGVYGNDVVVLTVKGMKSYLDCLYKVSFEEKSPTSSTMISISNNMLNFSKCYYDTNKDLISSYYLTESYQNNAKTISNLESATENKLTFEYLILNEFDYTKLALPTTLSGYATRASNFLKSVRVGGIA